MAITDMDVTDFMRDLQIMGKGRSAALYLQKSLEFEGKIVHLDDCRKAIENRELRGWEPAAIRREGLKEGSAKIAILDTSRARKLTWSKDGRKVEKAEASPRLLELLGEGYEVWIASTRTWDSFDPEGVDKCVFELIPKERIIGADPSLECGSANSEGLIDLWFRVLEDVGIPTEEIWSVMAERMYPSWMGIREYAKDQGVVVY